MQNLQLRPTNRLWLDGETMLAAANLDGRSCLDRDLLGREAQEAVGIGSDRLPPGIRQVRSAMGYAEQTRSCRVEAGLALDEIDPATPDDRFSRCQDRPERGAIYTPELVGVERLMTAAVNGLVAAGHSIWPPVRPSYPCVRNVKRDY